MTVYIRRNPNWIMIWKKVFYHSCDCLIQEMLRNDWRFVILNSISIHTVYENPRTYKKRLHHVIPNQINLVRKPVRKSKYLLRTNQSIESSEMQ
jgi:hypothetical protein